MTDYVSALPGTTVNPYRGAAYATYGGIGADGNPITDLYGKDSASVSPQLDKDAFLKLLVAQLRYQDPLNPSDPGDFIATTAQFTTIEELQKISSQAATSAMNSNLTLAGAMVGRQVAVIGPSGDLMAVAVLRALVVGGEVLLVTDKGQITLDQIVEIGGYLEPETPYPPPASDPGPGDTTSTDPDSADPEGSSAEPDGDPEP